VTRTDLGIWNQAAGPKHFYPTPTKRLRSGVAMQAFEINWPALTFLDKVLSPDHVAPAALASSALAPRAK